MMKISAIGPDSYKIDFHFDRDICTFMAPLEIIGECHSWTGHRVSIGAGTVVTNCRRQFDLDIHTWPGAEDHPAPGLIEVRIM